MRILENNALRISVSDHGAELCSVMDRQSGTERIWTADPAVWNRHSPILFPFVGKVNGGRYRIQDQEYSMKTQHGFARDMDFICEEMTDSSVTHSLTYTEDTLKIYPYAFGLQVRHSLDPDNERILHIDWVVENRGDKEMLFSIGGHPGFLMPPDVRKEDCFIVFPGREELVYFQVNKEGFAIPDKEYHMTLADGCAAYQENIPDTWIFSGQEIRSVGIAGPDHRRFITMDCEGFPMLAVWANPQGSFICLEPWFGRTDDAGFTGTLEEKTGMERLSPGASESIRYSVEFHSLIYTSYT